MSTSPVMRAGAFDCGERWVRVHGRVCGLMYVYCYCTAREEKLVCGYWEVIWVGVVCRAVERVDQGQEGLRIRSGRRPWALKTHMNRFGACE